MKRLLLLLLVIGTIFIFNTAVLGQDYATGNIEVRAFVIPTCQLRTGSIDFGRYGGVAKLGTGDLLGVKCLSPLPYKVDLDAGKYSEGERRKLRSREDSNHKLLYEIYRGRSITDAWGGREYGWDGAVGIEVGAATGDWEVYNATWQLFGEQFG